MLQIPQMSIFDMLAKRFESTLQCIEDVATQMKSGMSRTDAMNAAKADYLIKLRLSLEGHESEIDSLLSKEIERLSLSTDHRLMGESVQC